MYPQTVTVKIDGREATRNYKAPDVIVNYYYSIYAARNDTYHGYILPIDYLVGTSYASCAYSLPDGRYVCDYFTGSRCVSTTPYVYTLTTCIRGIQRL